MSNVIFSERFIENVNQVPPRLKHLSSYYPERFLKAVLKTTVVACAALLVTGALAFVAPAIIAVVIIPAVTVSLTVVAGIYFVTDEYFKTLPGKVKNSMGLLKQESGQILKSLISWMKE